MTEKQALTSSDINLMSKWLPSAFGVGGAAAIIAGLVNKYKSLNELAEKYEEEEPDDIFTINLNKKKAAKEKPPFTALGSGLTLAGVPIMGLLGYYLLDKYMTNRNSNELKAEIDALQNIDYTKLASAPGFGIGDALKASPFALLLLTALASGVVTKKVLDDQLEDPTLKKLREFDSNSLKDPITGAPTAFKLREKELPGKEPIKDSDQEGMVKVEGGEAKLASDALEHVVRTVSAFSEKHKSNSDTLRIHKAAALDAHSLVSETYDSIEDLVKKADSILSSSTNKVTTFSKAAGLSILCRHTATRDWVLKSATVDLIEESPMIMEVASSLPYSMSSKLASTVEDLAVLARGQELGDSIPETEESEQLLNLLLETLQSDEANDKPYEGALKSVSGDTSDKELEKEDSDKYDEAPNEDNIDQILS